MTTVERTIGASVGRVEGVAKVTGQARYAAEFPLSGLAYGWVVQSRIAKGRIASIDTRTALNLPGVLEVITHVNAMRLQDAGDGELLVLQDDRVHYRGHEVALVVATTLEQARAAADALRVEYEAEPHDVVLTADHPRLYAPEQVNPGLPTDTNSGDVEAAIESAAIAVDATYRTPAEHNNPMEPHASTARWDGDDLLVYDSTQGVTSVHRTLTQLFGLERGAVRVLSDHVGGGFGSKGSARLTVVLAAMAARMLDRPVRVTLSRPQQFSLVGYRTPTIQRIRLGAEPDGRLVALDHEVVEQTSTVFEFAEQTAVFSRSMYAAPNLRTRHRLVALDVPTPRWMRAPGEAPGSFALESAMDELAEACGVDPVELRIRNEPNTEPVGGRPFSSRNLVACLRQGAERIGWADRDPRPGVRRDGRWRLGTGVAASTYPARSAPSTASVSVDADGRYLVQVAAADIGTGARTALTQVAADELEVPLEAVQVRIADSDFGPAMIAGGSMGMSSWSWVVVKACRELRARIAAEGVPEHGLTVRADTREDIGGLANLARYAFGAQFAEVRVDLDTGEIRVPRLLGVFAVGRVVNARLARSQLIGGMIWGLSMAMFEESVMDTRFGDYLNHDLAGYHVPVNADVASVQVDWIDETDNELNPLGVKGVGEIGIVGTAAAIANAVYHATGRRQRALPIRPDRVL